MDGRPARGTSRYAIAVAALVLPTVAAGATLNLSTADDIVANDGVCSLREAISAANTNAPSGPAAGECPAGTVALDRIVLGARTFVLSRQGANEHANATGDLDLLGETTLVGSGPSLSQINAARIDRVMSVGPGAIVRVEGVTITGGRAPNGAPGAPNGGIGGPAATAGAS